MELTLRRPSVDRLIAATARHPMVVVLGATGVGKSAVLRHFAAESAWPAPLSLLDPELAEQARSDPGRFVQNLGGRTVLDDADAIAGLPAMLFALLRAQRRAAPGQLVVAVASSASVPVGFPPDAVVQVRPWTEAERRNGGAGALGALFEADVSRWRPLPITAEEYVRLAMQAASHAPEVETARSGWRAGLIRPGDRLDPTCDLVLKTIARSSGSWFDVDGLAARLGVGATAVAAALRQLRELQLVHHLAPLGELEVSGAGRYLVADVGAVAREYSLGGAALAAEHLETDAHTALVRTLVLDELLTQNGWLRHPVQACTWRASRGDASIDVILSPARTAPGPSVGDDAGVRTVALSVHADVRFDNEAGKALLGALVALQRRRPGAVDRAIVLYLGPVALQLAQDLYAVPASLLWSAASSGALLDVAPLDEELRRAADVLGRLRRGPRFGLGDVLRRRTEAERFLRREVAPLLDRVEDRLRSIGLEATVVMGTSEEIDLVVPDHRGLEPLAGARLVITDPLRASAHPWSAVIAAALDNDGATQWWVGHLSEPAPEPGSATAPRSADAAGKPAVFGQFGPLAAAGPNAADQLVAALVAGLADLAAELVRTS